MIGLFLGLTYENYPSTLLCFVRNVMLYTILTENIYYEIECVFTCFVYTNHFGYLLTMYPFKFHPVTLFPNTLFSSHLCYSLCLFYYIPTAQLGGVKQARKHSRRSPDTPIIKSRTQSIGEHSYSLISIELDKNCYITNVQH